MVFQSAQNTNLVEILLPVKFRLIPLSSFRQEVSKIEKVPRGIKGESREKDMASSVYWSISKSPKGGRNQISGKVSFPCWLATPVANASWKPLVIR